MVGKPWAEAKILSAGEAYEQGRGFDIPLALFP